MPDTYYPRRIASELVRGRHECRPYGSLQRASLLLLPLLPAYLGNVHNYENYETCFSSRTRFPPACNHAACTHCLSSSTFVSGPTPPGVGVTAAATVRTDATSTSPTIPPCGKALIPTSMTVAPGRTISAVTMFARPTATTNTSASCVNEYKFAVRE